MFNNDRNYAVSRILDTHMRTTNNTLEYIAGINGKDNCLDKATILSSGEDGNLNYRHISDFHYQVGPLGYVETIDGSVYVARTTIREDWRQGLRARQLICAEPGKPYKAAWRDIISANIRGFNSCLQNKYPNFSEELLERVEEDNQAVAFHRDYAVNSKFEVYYKHNKIGKIKVNGTILLDQKFYFLQEQLQQITDNYELA